MIPKQFRFLHICLLALIPGISSAVEKPPASWKTECIGRMQISLPGEVAIAAVSRQSWLKTRRRPRAGGGGANHEFSDGQLAGWSSTDYFGTVDITHQLSDEELESVRAEILSGREKNRQYARGEDNKADRLLNREPRVHDYADLSVAPRDGYAWEIDDATVGSFFVGGHLFEWVVNTETEFAEFRRTHFRRLLAGLRFRPLFDVPSEPGVCLPYLFVKDDGTPPRHIGMTYRLKDHPDITVWLEDRNAKIIRPNQNPDKFTAHYMAGFFWEQRYQNRRSFGSLWPGHKAFKPGTLAGYKGVKTFVELLRHDGTRDLGYLVAVRGDPEAKEDTPDLMLYVIQDSINARKRGIEPLSQEAFLRLAETIAASVKRRETQSQ